MARAKKVVENDGENKVETVNSPPKQKPTTKPAKRGFKSRVNNPPMGEMITAALKALKNDRGVALISIRKFISQYYDGYGKVGKTTQTEIKNYLADAFKNGKVMMVNDNGTAIKFNVRFNMVKENID